MCRVDNILAAAQDAVFGSDHTTFPSFTWEVLDWPEGGEDGNAGERDSNDARTRQPEPEQKSDVGEEFNLEYQTADGSSPIEEHGSGSIHQAGSEDSKGDGEGRVKDDASEEDKDDGGKDMASHDSEDIVDDTSEGRASSPVDKPADSPEEDSEDDDDDDADIETVRELDKLRTHFKWVRDRAKKRRKAHEPLNVDRSGIPNGLLSNIFLVIDQDVIDSIKTNSPIADNAWIWAIDPDYTGDVASMTKNGLKDEYYGYMRVRLQQLVNNFWDARHNHEDEQPLQTLWAAAQQSHNFAFVSLDPTEARMLSGDMLVGSALRARPVWSLPREA